ncbi:ParB/RepB/Spo0J family partition protein [Curtobacterium flaccumfaciens]|uniref:ParB/RepB/Spo0J family partition protein n=1 Tax=Curtobacterium flaccumfaciens TaxID=2035 RepID=UPI003879B52D
MTMTENIQTTTAAEGIDLVQVPAADVVIENNVRTAADLDPAFLASVKRHGVLLPTIGYRNADGAVVVRDGQMRVLAAREAAVTVPVFVTARDDSTAVRIVEQLVANERRTALTDGDRLNAYRQLELAGLSVAGIARETGTDKEQVKATLTVAKSEAATAAVIDRQVSFDAALLLAEFDGDEDATAELNEYISEGYDDELQFVAQQHRNRKIAEAEAVKVADQYREQGVAVVDDDTALGWKRLDNLSDEPVPEDDPRAMLPAVDPEAHTACEGHAVLVQAIGGGASVSAVCTTPEQHTARYFYDRPAPELTPEEEAERAAEAEAAAARRERDNRLQDEWTAAREVRRTWLAGLVGSKALPKDAARWTAATLLTPMRDYYGQRINATDLLGIPDDADAAEWARKRPGKAGHVAFAFALAEVESGVGRYGWSMPAAGTVPYLNQLVAWGYTLSHVEQIVTGAASADDEAPTDDEATEATEATEDADHAEDAAAE